MATLGNLLQRKGGTPLTGRLVKLTLPIPDPKGGRPLVADEPVEVLLLPVPESRKARAFRAAEAHVAAQQQAAVEAGEPGSAPSIADEKALRFFCEAMRDPEDARRYFVAAEQIDTFRDILIAEQIRLLLAEYDALIRDEYPESPQAQDFAAMKADAKDFSSAGQP